MGRFSFDIKVEDMARLEHALERVPEKVPIVALRALNRAADKAKTEMSREARKRYYIRYGDVQDAIKIYPANSNDLTATVIVKGRRRELVNFRVEPRIPIHRLSKEAKPKVLRVAVKKTGGLKDFPNAFVAIGSRAGKLHVLRRVGKSRYPLHIKYGPSVPQMIGNEEVITVVEEKVQETLDKRLEHEIKRALEEV